MARQETTKPAVDKGGELADLQQLQADADLVNQRTADLQVIDGTYGDNLPYDKNRIESEARFYLSQSAEAMLEAGKRLIMLKEHEPHGEFTETLERLGLAPRTARSIMQAAVKFGGSKRQTFAVLDKSKLFVLMTEDDDELEELAEGGTLAGKTLDEIDRMSVRELKQALRSAKQKAKDEAETNERMLADKNAKIDELDKALHKRDSLAGEELHIEQEKDLDDALANVMKELPILEKAIENITFKGDLSPEHLRGKCYHAIERIRSRVRDIELNQDVQAIVLDDDDLTDNGTPVWMED